MRTNEINPATTYRNHDDRLGAEGIYTGQTILDQIKIFDGDYKIDGDEDWQIEKEMGGRAMRQDTHDIRTYTGQWQPALYPRRCPDIEEGDTVISCEYPDARELDDFRACLKMRGLDMEFDYDEGYGEGEEPRDYWTVIEAEDTQ